MIIAHYDEEGNFASCEIDFAKCTPGMRADVLQWLAVQEIEPSSLPTPMVVQYDAGSNEWIFPVITRNSVGMVTGATAERRTAIRIPDVWAFPIERAKVDV